MFIGSRLTEFFGSSFFEVLTLPILTFSVDLAGRSYNNVRTTVLGAALIVVLVASIVSARNEYVLLT